MAAKTPKGPTFWSMLPWKDAGGSPSSWRSGGLEIVLPLRHALGFAMGLHLPLFRFPPLSCPNVDGLSENPIHLKWRGAESHRSVTRWVLGIE